MRWIGVEMANLPSSTALNKGLKPLAPTIWQRKNRGFGDLMTAPKPLVSEVFVTLPVIRQCFLGIILDVKTWKPSARNAYILIDAQQLTINCFEAYLLY